jgi:GT2 family glycosyltransferase
MLRMRDRTQSPPDGWLYTQPQCGWFNRRECPSTLWDLKELTKEVCRLRMQHPEWGASTDRAVIADEIDAVNAFRVSCMRGGEGHVFDDAPAAWPSPATFDIVTNAAPIKNGVSAVIPIYRPTSERLNRCLQAVVDQVDEVIVTMERDSMLPEVTVVNDKIKYVCKDESGIGFGRNVNFGCKHASHTWILILNDDVFLAPDAVVKMQEVIFPEVGIVGHLLRYPDGTIEHGGTKRVPGSLRWPHLDHGSVNPSITEPVEMENVCAASMLVRRKAFYQAGAFDEDIRMYCEDNALCLQMRHVGWKIIYTPHATGIHLGRQSSKDYPGMMEIIKQSCAVLDRKWAWYLAENPNGDLSKQTTGAMTKPKPGKFALVYIYPINGQGGFREKAVQFVESYHKNPPGMEHDTIIVCNGAPANDDAQSIFSSLPNCTFLNHDNSGWDLGGFQAAARANPCDLMVFFGSHTYFRGAGWLTRMVQAHEHFGDTLYGSTGNQGNLPFGVHPHVRTTAFWCSPELMAKYPFKVTTTGGGGERYEMEHGTSCLTNWIISQNKQPWIVGWDCAWPVQKCDSMPNGFHQGNQSNVLVGDRLTCPPYYPHP